MANKKEKKLIEESNKSNGPCLLSPEHDFRVISAYDPFTATGPSSTELFIEIACIGCGRTKRLQKK